MKLIIAANWKMNKTICESVTYFQEFINEYCYIDEVTVVVCPPYTSLHAVYNEIKNSKISLGAQNIHWEDKGAFTGEISALMLKELGVEYVIIGHSERRHIMGEDNQQIHKKLKIALDYKLKPILCVGETEKERESGIMEEVIREQFTSAFSGLAGSQAQNIIIAYEPVWAIGTGKAALPEDAEKAAGTIKKIIKDSFNQKIADSVYIQYGGSVNEDNIGSFVTLPSVKGVLVGGASLDAPSFNKLVRASGRTVSN